MDKIRQKHGAVLLTFCDAEVNFSVTLLSLSLVNNILCQQFVLCWS